MNKLMLVETYYNRMEAEVARSVLEGEDIEAFIMADDGGKSDPALTVATGGVHLIVQFEDLERARELLAAYQ